MRRWVGTLASPWPGKKRARERDEGDASVPSQPRTTPAPTDWTISSKKPTFVRLCWRMTFLIEAGRNGPQMEVQLPQHGPGFGDHQAQFHSLCHSPTKSCKRGRCGVG